MTLRPLRDDDLEEMCLLLGDADALAGWVEAVDRDGAGRWINRNLARYEDDGFGRCAIVLRATGALVGDCGLIRTAVEGGCGLPATHRLRLIDTDAAKLAG